jgi:ankyrin repeat protein
MMSLAAQYGHESVLRILVNHGIDVNIRDENGIPTLQFAMSSGKLLATKLLIENGADVHLNRTDGKTTPYSTVYAYGQGETLDHLIWHEGKPGASPSSELVSLTLVAEDGHIIKHSTSIYLRDDETLLHHAAYLGDFSTTEDLIKNGFEVNETRAENGATALFLAAQEGHGFIVDLLIKHGADVNATTRDA